MDIYFILVTFLKEIGYDFKNYYKNKDERIKLQKYVYGLQVVGVDLGYSYSLNINGPYSSFLVSDTEYIYGKIDTFTTGEYALSERGKASIQKFKEFYDNKLNDINWLETISTIHFLFTATFYKDKEKKDCIINKFKKLKPHLSSNEGAIEQAWEIASAM